MPPPRPLTADVAQQLQGRSVARTSAETPSFVATTAANASFAMVGALAAINAGKELVKTNGIEDPALRISEALGAALADKFHGEVKPSFGDAVGDSIEQIVAAAPMADVILDVLTVGWRFGYFASSWGTYLRGLRGEGAFDRCQDEGGHRAKCLHGSQTGED